MEIIPTVHVRLNETSMMGEWNCPGCGKINEVFLFSETLPLAKEEVKRLESVQCDGDSCARRFEVD